MADSSGKPRVLVLGGCGFIGRHLVTFLVEGKLASLIRVADKVPPAMAWLNPKHRSAFDHPSVEYVSTNLLSAVSRGNAFALEVGNWDFVINLAAETKPNQTEEVYHHGIVPLSLCCAQLAASLKVGRFIELSDGRIKTSPKKVVTFSCPFGSLLLIFCFRSGCSRVRPSGVVLHLSQVQITGGEGTSCH